jgi:hypothetical protein
VPDLVLVRHGQSLWNLENRFTGWVDVPLTATGEAEAARAGELLRGRTFAVAYTSALVRAQETLRILTATMGIDPPTIRDAALNERDYGDLAGLDKAATAERYGAELAEALPEADQVAGFGVPVQFGRKPLTVSSAPIPSFDLLNLPRPKSSSPWAYVKIAEGCDRNCGFCAIPSFRGSQRSRDIESILHEVDELQAKEIGRESQAHQSSGSIVIPGKGVVAEP